MPLRLPSQSLEPGMAITHLNPERRRRLELFLAFSAGICVYAFADLAMEVSLALFGAGPSMSGREHAAVAVQVALGFTILAAAYRLIWKSIQPGLWVIVTILALTAGMAWLTP